MDLEQMSAQELDEFAAIATELAPIEGVEVLSEVDPEENGEHGEGKD